MTLTDTACDLPSSSHLPFTPITLVLNLHASYLPSMEGERGDQVFFLHLSRATSRREELGGVQQYSVMEEIGERGLGIGVEMC